VALDGILFLALAFAQRWEAALEEQAKALP
jgi:hypothetical protein